MRRPMIATLAVLVTTTGAAAAPISGFAAPAWTSGAAVSPIAFRERDAFRDRSWWDRHHGRGYYDHHYRGMRRDDGAAAAAGFLGFMLGAAIAGSADDRSYALSRLHD